MEINWPYAHKEGLMERHSVMRMLHEEGWPEEIARTAAQVVPADKDGRGTIYSHPLAAAEARRLAKARLAQLDMLMPCRPTDIARAEADIARWRKCLEDESREYGTLTALLSNDHAAS